MSHTPGPWEEKRGAQTKLVRGISASTGKSVVRFHGIAAPTTEEGQANARLIAAAPDLLAALEDAFKQLDEAYGHGISNGYWPTIAPLHEQIRAAIKKARGA